MVVGIMVMRASGHTRLSAAMMGLGFRVAYPLTYNTKVVWRGSMAFAQWSELDCVNRPLCVNMLKADTVANLSGQLRCGFSMNCLLTKSVLG